MRTLPISFLLILFCFSSFCQTPDDNDNLQQKLEQATINVVDDADLNLLVEQLQYYKAHPLNLNRASREDLIDLILLNELQIDDLLNHIKNTGKLLSLEELQTIDEFDIKTIKDILPYVTLKENGLFDNITWKELLNGNSSLYMRTQQIMEKQAGYISVDSLSLVHNKSYLGSNMKLYTKYNYTYGKRLSIGITGEKDQGEQFFKGTQSNGYDFYSGHISYRGKGLIRNLCIGDYVAQYGQGLVMWSGFVFGKTSDVLTLKKNERGLVAYTANDENNFLRGAGVSIGVANWQADIFYSSHRKDANTILKNDSIVITSELTTGYHRTIAELSDKHTFVETITGAHLQFKTPTLNIGVTGFTTDLDKPIEKTIQAYNQFEFSGTHNLNYGIDYSFLIRNFHFFGEAAQSLNGSNAWVNGVLVSLDAKVGLTIMQRHFAKDYQALLSNAVSENTKNANEDALLIGVTAKPNKQLTLNAYFDQFHFPWVRYLVNQPTQGFEFTGQINYTPTKTFETYFRIKEQSKPDESNINSEGVKTANDATLTNFRFNIRYKVSSTVTFTNRIESVIYKNPQQQNGFLIFHDVHFKSYRSRYSFSARYVLFDCDSYDARIYSYENDVLYSFSIPFYYYRGISYYLLTQYRITKGIDVWLKFARTEYDNRKTVSNGLDEINTPHKSELKAQVRFEF